MPETLLFDERGPAILSEMKDRIVRGTPWMGWVDGKYMWSPGLFDLLGLEASGFEPSPSLFLSFVHPEDRGVGRILFQPNPCEGPDELTFRVARADGTVKLVSTMRLEQAEGARPGFVCVLDHSDFLEPPSGRELSNPRVPYVDTETIGLWTLLSGGDLYLSATSRRLLGLRHDERVGVATLLRQVHPDDQNIAEAIFDPGISTLGGPAFLRVRTFPGPELRYLEIEAARPLLRGTSQFGIWGWLRDVTSQQELEKELQQLRALTAALMDNSGGGIVILDRDLRVVQVNELARQIVPDIAVSRSIFEVAGIERDPLGIGLREVLGGGKRVVDERFVPGLGRWVSYSIAPAGGHLLLAIKCREEFYRLKAVVDEVSSRANAAFAVGKIAVWEFDSRTWQVWLAQPAREFLGLKTLDVEDVRRRIHPDDLERVDRLRDRAVADQTDMEFDFRFQVADGTYRLLRCRGAFLRDLVPELRRMAGVLIDLESMGDAPREPVAPAAVWNQSPLGSQVRAARGALRWSVRELAEASGVSVATINRFEAEDRSVSTRGTNVAALFTILQDRGIGFHTGPHGHPAIEIAL